MKKKPATELSSSTLAKPAFQGIDLTGLGKLAKAIPPEVYTRTSESLNSTFEKLVAPVVETTSGFGRYVRQKFDNMVDVEKALATLSIQEAVEKRKGNVATPAHPKSFIKSLEEASKETDPELHEMWVNLLATQMGTEEFHPHFVELLTHFSPGEARLLEQLVDRESIGENGGGYFLFGYDTAKFWKREATDPELRKWTTSCALLCEFGLADVTSPKGIGQDPQYTILHRTTRGADFLKMVSTPSND